MVLVTSGFRLAVFWLDLWFGLVVYSLLCCCFGFAACAVCLLLDYDGCVFGVCFGWLFCGLCLYVWFRDFVVF